MSEAVQEVKKLLYETRNLYFRNKKHLKKNVSLGLGNRRLIFGQTYKTADEVIKDLFDKKKQNGIYFQ